MSNGELVCKNPDHLDADVVDVDAQDWWWLCSISCLNPLTATPRTEPIFISPSPVASAFSYWPSASDAPQGDTLWLLCWERKSYKLFAEVKLLANFLASSSIDPDPNTKTGVFVAANTNQTINN